MSDQNLRENEQNLQAARIELSRLRSLLADYERLDREASLKGNSVEANDYWLLAQETRGLILVEESKIVQFTSAVELGRRSEIQNQQNLEAQREQQIAQAVQSSGDNPRLSVNDPEMPPPPTSPASANEISGAVEYRPVPDITSPTGYRDELTGLPFDMSAATQVDDVVVTGTRSQISVAPTDHRIRVKPLNPEDLYGPMIGESGSDEQSRSDHLLKMIQETNGVVFPYTPSITYSHQVNYTPTATVHANQDYHFYNNTSAVQFQILAKFTAQNEREAQYLLASKHFFQTVSKMHFGEDEEKRGLPPPVLVFSGYGDLMFNNLPVIMTSFLVDLPDDQDYVKVDMLGVTSWVPAVMNFQLTFTVQQTPSKQRTFNFGRFASGEQLKERGWI